jgi:hypothetical protein
VAPGENTTARQTPGIRTGSGPLKLREWLDVGSDFATVFGDNTKYIQREWFNQKRHPHLAFTGTMKPKSIHSFCTTNFLISIPFSVSIFKK